MAPSSTVGEEGEEGGGRGREGGYIGGRERGEKNMTKSISLFS